MATIYRSTDTGAPALPASGNYNAANFYIELIKKCLVDGYGSKPGAGWSVVYDDTTPGKRRAAFSNGNGCIEFITWSTQSVAMVIWDSITSPGVGRGFDDSFSTVMSSGVNGWKSKLVSAPGIPTENISSINLNLVNSSQNANVAWTVFADDKSAWVLIHYPTSHGSSSPTLSPSLSSSQHSQIFFGAVKSSDLLRDTPGNFYLLYGAASAGSSSSIGSAAHYIAHCFGLRTPFNTLPMASNNSEFGFTALSRLASLPSQANPYGSVRHLFPVIFFYNGIDTLKTPSLAAADAWYGFAVIPGLAQISDSALPFWPHFNAVRSATSNLDSFSLADADWMPWAIQSSVVNMCLTDNENWWA